MSVYSSPYSSPIDSFTTCTAQPSSEKLLEWHQLHYVRIPLVNALYSATAPPKCTTRDGCRSPRMSPTPSLLGDDASSSRHGSPLLSPRSFSQASPDAEKRRQTGPSPHPPRHHSLQHRNTAVLHSMVTRSGSRQRRKGRILWELDQSGLRKRRARR